MKTWAWGAAAASLSMMGIAACKGGSTTGTTAGTGGATTSVTSSSSTATGGNAPGCGTTQYSSKPQCQACIEAGCCSELLACTAGTSCDALLKCLVANSCSANDPTCTTSCETQNSAGVPFVMALQNCFDNACAGAMVCQTGAICQSGLQVQNVECGMCLGNSCCPQWTACGADATCAGCATSQGSNTGCDTNTLYMAATGCEAADCSSDCTAICDTGLTTNNPQCDTCLGSNCCSAFEACVNDSNCDECLLASPPPEECTVDNTFIAVTTCQSMNCATECTSGG